MSDTKNVFVALREEFEQIVKTNTVGDLKENSSDLVNALEVANSKMTAITAQLLKEMSLKFFEDLMFINCSLEQV